MHLGIRRHDFILGRARDLGLDLHFGERSELGNVASPLPVGVINRLIVSGERLVCDDDAL